MSGPTTPSSSTPIIDNNALTASLRALKLGGMLQTLDARLAQARAGELGHLEFLQVLCQRLDGALRQPARRRHRIERDDDGGSLLEPPAEFLPGAILELHDEVCVAGVLPR